MTIYLLGLDGASLDNLQASMKRTKLPSFERVINSGTTSDLLSVYPYVTAPAWTTIFTGVNPGKHGIFEMFDIINGTIVPSNMRTSKVPFLWNYLSWANKRTLVMGVPFIYPAPEVKGIFVTGRFVPRFSCFPDKIKEKFDLSGFEYEDLPTEENIEAVMVSGAETVGRRMILDLEKRIAAYINIIDSDIWDAVIIADSLPDDLFHFNYDNNEIIDEMFRVLDSLLEKILSRMRESDTLLIVSDHGFTNVEGVIFINEWLRSKKYLKVRQSLMSRILFSLGLGWDRMSSGGTTSHLYSFALKHFPELLASVKNQVQSGFILDVSKQLSDSRVVGLNINEPVAWVRINQTSKSNIDLDELVNQLTVELKNRGLLRNVFKTSDIYSGNCIHKSLGQILIEAKDGWAIDTSRLHNGKLEGKPLLTKKGIHKRQGLFVAYGARTLEPSIQPSIQDIVPTILQLMKLPIPKYLDGKPMNEKGSNSLPWTLNVS
jgi:predicted AlkP superfamily phosphohydrolase/phosphomutase